MGNTSVRPYPRQRNKKQVHWKAAVRPVQPGKPHLVSETDITPDVVTIQWDPPVKDGGSPIIGYLVEHRRTGSPHWVRATPILVPFTELKLSGLEPGWRYQFRVSAENAVGMSNPSELSEPLTVTLQRSAITSPRFTQELADAVALENEKVEFVSYFLGQPAPKICWFKDGFEIFSSRRTRIITESDRSVLTIHQSALCDEGEIKCTATNKAGHASTKAKLKLEAPPSIRLPRQYEDGVLFEIGEVMRLKVSVAGLPTPLVFWSHNGETINNDERCEIDNSDKSSTLRIGEAKRTDRGEYQIKALNKLGQVTASFLVTVTDKPSQPGKATVVMTLGRSVTLAWNTPEDDGGCKIGNYIIEYYRLGWEVWLKAATSRQLTTVLGDLIEGSEYKFRVKAESPYGVSEPSEESEIVFIPDPKRGILAASTRSRSQPRDVPFSQDQPPILPERKNKPRSSSSTRVESPTPKVQFNTINSDIPIRPDRMKIKSPPKTPEMSPKVVRRDVLNSQSINRAIFDRASITRDLTYGSPEIKVTKNDETVLRNQRSRSRSPSPFLTDPPPKNTIQIIDNMRPRSPSPMIKSRSPSPMIKGRSPSPIVKSRSPSPNRYIKSSLTPSPKSDRRINSRTSRENAHNFSGSSEFMLVLLPNGNKGHNESDDEFNFDDSLIPPPLSLSAPELGVEPPIFVGLKYSSSSSELLHERAMMRFYEAAEAEELELKKRLEQTDNGERRQSVIPKIQINNKDEQDIVGLERTISLRRRYSGGVTTPHQVMLTQRRHSLRNSVDYSEVIENRLHKFPLTIEEKRQIMMNRSRSKSEEKEEEEFEKVRSRMIDSRSKLERRNNLDVLDLDKWEEEINEKEEEYEESLSEESESEDETEYDQVPPVYSDEEEYQTYHPRTMSIKSEALKRIDSEPFQILTKPNKIPDPNFVPKPILKRKLEENGKRQQDLNIKQKQRSLSLTSGMSNNAKLEATSSNKTSSLPRAPIFTPESNLKNSKESFPTNTMQSRDTHTIASMTGLAAASIIVPKAALPSKINEEAKIVVDHYSDIVRSYGQNRRRSASRSGNRVEERDPHVDDDENAIQTTSEIQARTETMSEENRNLDRPFSRNRNESESSSQRSMSPIKTKPISNRRGSPTVLNKDVFMRGRETKPMSRNKRTPSKSPASESNSSRRQSRRSSKSPEHLRKTSNSPSPWNRESADFSVQTRQSPTKNSPPSKLLPRPRTPKMKEITTQTSTTIDPYIQDTTSKMSFQRTLTQTELKQYAENKVRSTVDYITDLAMFSVACWLYIFSNELYAVPILIIMVYRQLQEAIRKRIPKWMLPKPKQS